MQRAVRKHWRNAAKREHKPKRPKDFGFINPWQYAIEIGSAFAQFGILPCAGGWEDQYESDKQDISEYIHGLNYYQWREYQKDEPGAVKPVEHKAFPDWTEYTQ